MKKLLLFSLFIFSFYSCKKDQSKVELTNLLSELGDEKQKFTISSDSITEITGEYGTRILVNPADLVLENGRSARGKIRLELTELTTKEALIRHNAQTRSGDDWLISGGAYNIQLFGDSGEELKLREGKSLEVQFPKFADEPMQLFSGTRNEETMMNWELKDEVLQEQTFNGVLVERRLVIDEESTRAYRVDTAREIESRRDLGKISTIQLEEYKNSNKTDSIFFQNDTVYILEKTIFDFLEGTMDCLGDREKNNLWRTEKILYENIQLAKLGWINVDRLYPDIEERIELQISNGDQFTLLYVIDESNNTVLNLYAYEGYKISLPKGRQFKLLGFFLEDEQLFAAKKAIRLIEDRKLELKMKAIDLEDIDKYLN
ncbi:MULTISPECIES: hypothetical protein [unclassified Leeuwenhoekiella]|uniref:hypothetical protein n=1 Tax=unclassified Leeuwenhoekiella TaxID=2615029 RepID=UPI000C479D3A|nr:MULTISPECIES: hypothetical protein [unclassified Leeuwenhoekiella]MAW95776.1 hypothetical protein [Leeuwenhoekiella sp.]MBA82953.1 hypothetical protein [Leeuwenhoekiella sp.]|tara:strand:+ start:611 stop:1732 length:1122 start_codon:yes stop_codon:yes gene_type:complete